MERHLIIEGKDRGRADKVLAYKFPEYSRNYFLNLIKNKHVLINEKSIKPSYVLVKGDMVKIDFLPPSTIGKPKAQKIDLDIIYEDDNVIVLNKPAGLVVHPAHGNTQKTLVNALIAYFPKIIESVYDKNDLVSINRPGLVHRLDKDTSGAMIIAKNLLSMKHLFDQFKNHRVRKTYWAICFNWPKESSGQLINYLGRHPKNRQKIVDVGRKKGRMAISKFKLIQTFETKGGKCSLIEFKILTGRTHQIRVQSRLIGNPVLGDAVYFSKDSKILSNILGIERQLLHAKKLDVVLPNKIKMTCFEAPLPSDFIKIIL